MNLSDESSDTETDICSFEEEFEEDKSPDTDIINRRFIQIQKLLYDKKMFVNLGERAYWEFMDLELEKQ